MGDDTTDPGRAVGNDSLFAADREGWESDASHQITTTDGTLWNDNVFDRLEGGPGNDHYYVGSISLGGLDLSHRVFSDLSTYTFNPGIYSYIDIASDVEGNDTIMSKIVNSTSGALAIDVAGHYTKVSGVGAGGGPERWAIGGTLSSEGYWITFDPGTNRYVFYERELFVAAFAIENFTDGHFGVTIEDKAAPTPPPAGPPTQNGTPGADTMSGGAGTDIIAGGSGNDSISAGAGGDLIDGGAGADTIDGGDGTDIVTYVNSTAAVNIDLNRLTAQIGGDAQGDILVSIQSVIGSGFDDTIVSSYMDAYIDGGAGSDSIIAAGGADIIIGGLGNDTIRSGDGADSISAGDGSDSVFGGNGNDSIDGGIGADTLIGGAGADTLDGGLWTDTVDYSASAAGVAVSLAAGAVGAGGDAAGDVLIGVEVLVGSGWNDTLIGGSGYSTLIGGAGNDILYAGSTNTRLDGGSGNDSMYGGMGNDSFVVDSTGDFVTDSNGSGTDRDTVYTTLNTYSLAVGNNIEQVVFTGVGNFVGTGNELRNYISGGDGNDTLTGGSAAGGQKDTLDGGLGNDVLGGSPPTVSVAEK